MAPAPRRPPESFPTKYGSFAPDGREYVVTTPHTPRPWINVLSNGDYGLTLAHTGSGYSWRAHAQLNRITRWEQDLVRDAWGKYLYLTDDRGNLWSAGWKPVCAAPERYRCRHGIGYTVIENRTHGVASELLVFVPNGEPLEVWQLTLRNTTRRRRRLGVVSFLEWGLGQAPDWHREFHRTFIETSYDPRAHALLATKRLWEVPAPHGHWNASWPYTAFHSCSARPAGYDADKQSFLGQFGSERAPAAVVAGRLARRTGRWGDAIAALQVRVTLEPGEERTIFYTVGAAASADEAGALARKYHDRGRVRRALGEVHDRWRQLLSAAEVATPDPAIDLMANTWLKYQAISGRMWGRTAYYQTGGAIGFRDQLQDSLLFLSIDPSRTAAQILLHASHQFADGTVYHWWHPVSEIGLRNQVSDNLLWLPFAVVLYLRETLDATLLDARAPFVDDPAGASVYEHCTRAIDRALTRFSHRGLPLIGSGDWNDGLSAVGLGMKGESVWLGHFLHMLLLDFAEVSSRRGDALKAELYRGRAQTLRAALNDAAWDGEWYYRATKDSGEKIGSAGNREGRIFLNAQTWAVIAGVADPPRAAQVMDAVERHLERKAGPLLLFPAYRAPDEEIGYLSRYAPGVRENGGVYTHAATWAVLAETVLGRGAAAHRMASKINPARRGMKPDEYCAEPYVTPGNIDGPDSPHYGRGGWTWYTGSAAWLYRVILEYLLGVRATYDGLLVDPCIPAAWRGFSVRRRFRGATYDIRVANPARVECGVRSADIDGRPVDVREGCRGVVLPAGEPGAVHAVVVTMGPRAATAGSRRGGRAPEAARGGHRR